MKMKVLGVVGQAGTGKSTAVAMIGALGAEVIDADRVAREIMVPPSPLLADVEREFGDSVLHEDGGLDREALAAICFSSREDLRRLNAIVHPALKDEVERRLHRIRERPQPPRLAVIDAAVLIESGMVQLVDHVLLCVVQRKEIQIERLSRRMGVKPEEAEQRIACQADEDSLRARADYVIDTTDGPDSYREDVQRFFYHLSEGVPARYGVSSCRKTES